MILKKILLLLFFLISTIFASNFNNVSFTLKNSDEKIGTLTLKTFLFNKKIVHSLLINIKFTQFFMTYKYLYSEKAIIKDDMLISFSIIEDFDGEIIKVSAIKKGKFIVYKNSKILDISKIDYHPFLSNKELIKSNFTKNKFNLITFEPLTGELLYEEYKLLSSDNYYKYEVSSNLEEKSEIMIFSKDGDLIYTKNELFEAFLNE
jgi:hypothetical protein